MSLTLGLMIGGAVLQGIGSLVGAGRKSEQNRREQAFRETQFNNNMARMDIAEKNLGLQKEQAGIQLGSDLRNMQRQRSQQVGGMTAMAAASGIVTSQSSMGAEIQDTDDQFLQGINDREKFGQIQMKGFDNQLSDMALQRQGMREALAHGQDMTNFENENNWINAGFNIAATGTNFAGSGYQNNWWRPS